MSRTPHPWRLIGICLLVVGGSVSLPAGALADENIEGVRHFLRATYSNPVKVDEGDESGINGPHFYARTKIEPIRIEALESLLPNTTFYKTHIDRPDWDFRTVDMIVARTVKDQTSTFAIATDMLFSGMSPEFIEQFVGLKLETQEKQLTFAKSFGELLVSVSSSAAAEVVEADSVRTVRIHFAHRDRLWRIIDIKLDQQDRIASIHSERPSKLKAE